MSRGRILTLAYAVAALAGAGLALAAGLSPLITLILIAQSLAGFFVVASWPRRPDTQAETEGKARRQVLGMPELRKWRRG